MEHRVQLCTAKATSPGSRRRATGQGMTEYVIIVALIALASVVAVGFFGNAVKAQFVAMAAELTGADGAAALAEVTSDVANQQGTAAATLGTYTAVGN